MDHYVFTYEKYIENCYRLLAKIKGNNIKYDAIICPLRGGFFLSYFMSRHLNLPIEYLEISSYKGKEQGDFFIGLMPDLTHGHYLLCDDIYDSGNTITKIRDLFKGIDMDIFVLLSKKEIPGITWGELVEHDRWVDFFWEIM